jgi:ABC-type multidrug transport system fused ATPase/permease subunit
LEAPVITTQRFPYHLVYLGFVLCVVTVSFFIVRTNGFAENTELLSLAVTLDIVLVIPMAYFLLAFWLGWRKLTVIPIFLLSLVGAHLVLPEDGETYLKFGELALAPIELFVLIFLILKVRQIRRRYRAARRPEAEFQETLEGVLAKIIDHPRFVRVLATELSIIYYGLFAWRNRPRHTTNNEVFTYDRKSGLGLIAGVFFVLIAIETPVLHYVISLKFPLIAWVVTALGLYGAVFILGDLNACRWRPIRVRAGNLELNTGLRWRCTIPLSQIEFVESTTFDIESREGLLNAAVIGNQNLVIFLKSKHTATGIYGFEKEFDRVAVTADEPSRLAAALVPSND